MASTFASADCAHSSADAIRPAEDRPRTGTANSALDHVLRRLEWEAANPDITHPAEFESSIEFEAPMW
ncbi:hypothetical protein [Streptomyces adelaidensis]|uniref:hypothetical protein n=1 Tax=Streptomyces adelaidensis TaxID=2796465 RepID=UPI001907BFC8|nr:hypothetical protein [Streptomyces adelaidensis]